MFMKETVAFYRIILLNFPTKFIYYCTEETVHVLLKYSINHLQYRNSGNPQSQQLHLKNMQWL
jgi:hypothetical protein